MRILNVELRNYRGVSERLVEFAPQGVTIIEGPNEIGKSSIPEAIDRLIEDMDSSSKQRVMSVKPVDRDVGPEVMIEAEAGAYAFTYRKRFIRDRITELGHHPLVVPSGEHVIDPDPERLLGGQRAPVHDGGKGIPRISAGEETDGDVFHFFGLSESETGDQRKDEKKQNEFFHFCLPFETIRTIDTARFLQLPPT